jgi:hypothetical protein
MGSKMGWSLHVVPPYMLEGQVVSSTAIRTLLAAGAVRGVADLLGRNYSISGELRGNEFLVDPLRALPRTATAFDAQLAQDDALHDVVATVQPTPGRIALETSVSHQDGPATLTFLRRGD